MSGTKKTWATVAALGTVATVATAATLGAPAVLAGAATVIALGLAKKGTKKHHRHFNP